jgi:hypothetical protein
MGYQLLRQAEAKAMGGGLSDLTPTARLVLLVMCLNARDMKSEEEADALYFRGHEHLARVALGRTSYTVTDKRKVAQYVAELVAATRHGFGMYRITLNRL